MAFIAMLTSTELQNNYPDAVAELVAASASVRPIDEHGRVLSGSSGDIVWEPPPKHALLDVFPSSYHGFRSAEGTSIGFAESVYSLGNACCHEMPRLISRIITSEPTGSVATCYQMYVKSVLMPLARRVSKILIEHSAVIEWPNLDWLSQKVQDNTDSRNSSRLSHGRVR
eukprot:SAG31_NODE_135_length_23206_cov_25.707967_5_plen_170_part_00